jgi:hypothetical protein
MIGTLAHDQSIVTVLRCLWPLAARLLVHRANLQGNQTIVNAHLPPGGLIQKQIPTSWVGIALRCVVDKGWNALRVLPHVFVV